MSVNNPYPSHVTEVEPFRWGLWIFRGFFTLIFLVFFFGAARQAWNDRRQMKTFQPVPITVVSSRIVEHRSAQRKNRIKIEYEPVIIYQYQINGKTFEGGRVWPSGRRRSADTANAMIQKYQVGKTYTGYYDPANPADSFLERETNLNPYCVMIMIPIMTLVPAFMMGRERRVQADPILEARYERRKSLLFALPFLLVGVCTGLSALGKISNTSGTNATMLRLMLAFFALVFGGVGLALIIHAREAYRHALKQPKHRQLSATAHESPMKSSGALPSGSIKPAPASKPKRKYSRRKRK